MERDRGNMRQALRRASSSLLGITQEEVNVVRGPRGRQPSAPRTERTSPELLCCTNNDVCKATRAHVMHSQLL